MLFLFHKMAECEFHSVYVAVRAKGASLRVGALVGLVVTYAPSRVKTLQDLQPVSTSIAHCVANVIIVVVVVAAAAAAANIRGSGEWQTTQQ